LNWLPHAQDASMEVAIGMDTPIPKLHKVPLTRDSIQDFFIQQQKNSRDVCSWVAVLALRVLGPEMPVLPLGERYFDVAISYSGADREVVEKFWKILRESGISVFYDKEYEAELWGEDLQVSLPEIYGKQAQYCVIFISQNYQASEWTKIELRYALERLFKQKSTYILPILMDDTVLEGIPESFVFQDLRRNSIENIAKILIRKLKR
jgi:hypothetical protein